MDEKTFTKIFSFGCHESIVTKCSYSSLNTKKLENDLYNILYVSDYSSGGGVFYYLLEAYLDIDNYDKDTYCNNEPININQYNLDNNCVDLCPCTHESDSSNGPAPHFFQKFSIF